MFTPMKSSSLTVKLERSLTSIRDSPRKEGMESSIVLRLIHLIFISLISNRLNGTLLIENILDGDFKVIYS